LKALLGNCFNIPEAKDIVSNIREIVEKIVLPHLLPPIIFLGQRQQGAIGRNQMVSGLSRVKAFSIVEVQANGKHPAIKNDRKKQRVVKHSVAKSNPAFDWAGRLTYTMQNTIDSHIAG
jgi:hypothetical protein